MTTSSVIPACFPVSSHRRRPVPISKWVPASAGMTRNKHYNHYRRPKRATAKTTTSNEIAMTPMPTAPHRVEVRTVMRKFADSD